MEDSKKSEKSKNETIAYQILAEVSNLDVKLMWDRSNVLLVLQGFLLAFIGSNYSSNDFFIELSVLLFGCIMSILWWRVTKGGSFWVNHWEERMRNIENQTFGSDIKIYREHPSVAKNKLKKEYRKKGYISTRKTLIFLSIIMSFIWIFLIIYNVINYFFM